MNPTVLHLASLSAKVALLGGIAWTQLYLLRRAPALSRSRLCALSILAVLLLAAGELFAPSWAVTGPAFTLGVVAARAASPVGGQLPVASLLAWLWIAGAAFMLLRAIAGRAAVALVRRRSTKLDPDSTVDIRIAAVQTPILTGWLRPTILLPEAARGWSEEQRRMVLAHELTHFGQGDVWTNLLAQIVRAVLWFHPVVWLLVSRLSREQELTCDEAVVASGHSRHEYAAFLLDAVRNLKSQEMFACAMAGSGAQSLKERFAKLLDPMPRPELTRRIMVSLASLALVAMAMTVVRPVWSQSQGVKKVYKVGEGITPPKLLSRVEPSYTQEARDARIEGKVSLKAVVTAEGVAEDIEVVEGLGAGLDEKAVEAIKQWTFQPATKEGQAVAVWAKIEVNFRLK